MGIMVYSLLWVMQDFVHQPNDVLSCDVVRDGASVSCFQHLSLIALPMLVRACPGSVD